LLQTHQETKKAGPLLAGLPLIKRDKIVTIYLAQSIEFTINL